MVCKRTFNVVKLISDFSTWGYFIMIVNEELNRELEIKLFRPLAIVACLANVVGFWVCFLLNGVLQTTIICGICSLIIAAFGIFGWKTGRVEVASTGIVSIVAFLELPVFIYVYGVSMSAYLILAVAGIVLFLPKSSQWIMFGIVFLIDIICIALSYIEPFDWPEETETALMLASMWAYCIVAITLFVLVRIIFIQYDKQRSEIIKMTEELELVAHYDQLTGLYNRRYMMDTLEKWMTTTDKDFIVVHVDLDDFKMINDTYGFVFGDTVLVEFSKILKENVKDVGFASRYGGQEFVVMIDNASKEETIALLEKVKEEFNDFSAKAKQARFTFSAGLVVDDKTLDLDEILATADDRLRQAKRAGKNQIKG